LHKIEEISYPRLNNSAVYGRMGKGREASAQVEAWPANASRIGPVAREASRARLHEERAKSASVAVVSSLFLLLVAAALLVGGHVTIGPLLQSAIAAREAKGIGEIVYTMPDGVFCRHVSFDNVTAEVAESAIAHCPDTITARRTLAPHKFVWGTD
jgi:hypothetical protein